MIKVVFFDLGNVIMKVNMAAAIARIAEEFHVPETAVLEPSLLVQEKRFEKGQMTIEEHLSIVKKVYKFDGNVGIAELENVWQAGFELNRDVWRIVQKVRQKTPVFLLSNTNELHIRAVRKKYDVLDNLDGLVFSYEAGSLKPEPEIYHYALRKAGIAAEQALFIDDLAENVAAAIRLGIRAHQFSDVPGLESFLSDNGLRV